MSYRQSKFIFIFTQVAPFIWVAAAFFVVILTEEARMASEAHDYQHSYAGSMSPRPAPQRTRAALPTWCSTILTRSVSRRATAVSVQFVSLSWLGINLLERTAHYP